METAGHENSESPCVKTGVNLPDSTETSQNKNAVDHALSSVPVLVETTVESSSPNVAENTTPSASIRKRQTHSMKKPRKHREEWDKEGKYKYLSRQIKELRGDVRLILKQLAFIENGLEHEFEFESDLLESLVSKDDIDRRILSELAGSSSDGILPRDIAKSVGFKSVTPMKVTNRIRQLNKRMFNLYKRDVAEKRGMRWAMTDWMRDSYGEKTKEVR